MTGPRAGASTTAERYPARLLDDYLRLAGPTPRGSLAATVLRTRSLDGRLLLSRAVSRSMGATPEDLVRLARDPLGPAQMRGTADFDPAAMEELARVIALQELNPTDRAEALDLCELLLAAIGGRNVSRKGRAFHAQLAFVLGHRRRAAQLLKVYRVPAATRTALETDLANPFLGGGASTTRWLRRVGRLFQGPAPYLTTGDASPFDRLAVRLPPAPRRVDATISVVITAFEPDSGLLTAVRSIAEQTWTNLEILLIDDGSPARYGSLLDRAAAVDARVRLIRLGANRGTYAARNAGLQAAHGTFVTFQDSDDWSHPARLERQVRPLLDDPSVVATVSEAVAVTDELVLTRLGRKQLNMLNTSSLMVRRNRVVGHVGYFDPIRKAADTEYLRRICAAFGDDAVRRLSGRAHALIRLTPNSLSRAELRRGWMHPARAAYRSAYSRWHARVAAGADPYRPAEPAARPFSVPRYLAGVNDTVDSPEYDVVVAGDWRSGGPQLSMIEEIRAIRAAKLRVAVLHLEEFRSMTKDRRSLWAPVQDLINSGVVDQVVPSDEVDVRLLVVRSPSVFQFTSADPVGLRARRVMVLAGQAPSEADGADWRYVPTACSDAVRRSFGVEPIWCPQDPAVRAALASADGLRLAGSDLPGLLDPNRWRRWRRAGFRSDRPVLGKHSRDDRTTWPGDADTTFQVYPDSDEFDVRFMGGAPRVRAMPGNAGHPPNWVVYDDGETTVESFLFQLDFYVCFPHPARVEMFGRSVLEALASGCVAILPPRFEKMFGDAAVYCAPAEVKDRIRRFRADRRSYVEQSERAQLRVRQRFSPAAYVGAIRALL